jgi:hypothetical protein
MVEERVQSRPLFRAPRDVQAAGDVLRTERGLLTR